MMNGKTRQMAKWGWMAVALSAMTLAEMSLAQDSLERSGAAAVQDGSMSLQGRFPKERIRWHIPDPMEFQEDAPGLIRAAEKDASDAASMQLRDRETAAKRRIVKIRRVQELIDEISRPNSIRLSLEQALHAALKNNYAIEIASFNPAIRTAGIVQAEAAFDALFFTNITKNIVDRPSGSQLLSTDLDFFQLDMGIAKRLPLGTQVRATFELRRTKQAFAFQLINPEYFSTFILEFRQPMLRGFGLDVNRTQITVSQHERDVSQSAFRRQVRDTMINVERAYWQLVQTRRNYVVTARILPEYEQKLSTIRARGEHDTLAIHVSTTEAAHKTVVARLIEEKANLHNAQDALITLMNRDDLNLVDEVELIPSDFPPLTKIVIDRLAEVQTALHRHPDITEQQHRVAIAKTLVGQSINDELPQLDVTFRTTHDGLSGTADRAFDELTRRKFIEYFIGINYEIPVGNRARRAARRTRELEHAQQTVVLQQMFDKVILDVNISVRVLDALYDELIPLYESTEARQREVSARIARQETWNAEVLINELNSYEAFEGVRIRLLDRMLSYQRAILDLEKSKGTMLDYNNVVLDDETPTQDSGN